MNLRKKKELAARTLGVGKARILFVKERLEEIKEAITKQDIKDLKAEGAIIIKPIKGRKTNVKRKYRRGPGKVRLKIKADKSDYVKMTRKLRAYVVEMIKHGKISKADSIDMRKKIRNKYFKSKTHLREYINQK